MKKDKIWNSPKYKYGGYATLLTFLVITAILLLNLLASYIDFQIDMTDRGVFTLSSQTIGVVRELREDVVIILLARLGEEDPRIMASLSLYEKESSRIRIQLIDAEKTPGLVSKYDPKGSGLENGSVIVEGSDRFRIIRSIDLYSIDNRNLEAPQMLGLNVERRITNALIFVASGQTPIIYQVTGHGEIDLTLGGAFRRLGDHFKQANFEIRMLNLAQAQVIPEDGSILALIRPRTDISESEADKIREFLMNGGKGFFAIDLSVDEIPNISSILERYGIGIPSGIVIEPNRNYNNGDIFELWPQLTDTSITKPLVEANYRVFTPLVRPVVQLDIKPGNVTIEPLLITSPDSFYRTRLDIQSPQFREDDIRGPVIVAARATEQELITNSEISRIVVVGDTDFIYLVDQVNGNLDFLLNLFGWLEDQDETLSIRPQITIQLPLHTTGKQKLIFGSIFMILTPFFIMLTGLIVWMKRRNL